MICSLSSVITLALMIRFDLFKTFIHAVLATILITFVNSITGALVANFFFSGITVHPVDYIMTAFLSVGQSFLSASFWARLPINLIDKGIAVFIVFGITVLRSSPSSLSE
jgi:energy-coupling factor transport system substrate-specific component